MVTGGGLYYFRDSQSAKHLMAAVRGSDNHIWRRQSTNDTWDTAWMQFSSGTFSTDPSPIRT